MSVTDEDWFLAMKAKGHLPRMSNGRIDMFVEDAGCHNGPGCETCDWSCCEHCTGIEDIPECENPPLDLTAGEIAGALPRPQSEPTSS
jgi:hypothetical protein